MRDALSTRMGWHRIGVAALVVGIFFISWGHLYSRGQIPVDGNLIRMVYPNWVVARMPLGSIPLWNPYRNMGEPFLADPQTMAGYPIYWLTTPHFSFLGFMRFWVGFHTLLGAAGIALLAYRWYRNGWAAAVSALVFGLNGYFTSRITLPNHFASLAWVPVVLLFTEMRAPVFLALALACQWLAGFPPFSLLTALAVAILAAGDSKKWKGVLIGGFFAAALAAFQWLPFMEFLQHSVRPLFVKTPDAFNNSETLSGLLKMMLPEWYAYSPKITGDQALTTLYFGSGLLLAIWAACRGSKRERLLGIVAVVSVILSLGETLPFYPRLFTIFRFPANWLLLTTVSVALLAGGGMSMLAPRWKPFAFGIVAIDLVCFAQFVRVPWIAAPLLAQTPSLAASLQDPAAGRLYSVPMVHELFEQQGWKSLDDFQLMKSILIPSFGMAFGVQEVTSYQVLTLKEASAYQARLLREGPRSPLARWARIAEVVTLVPNASEVSVKTVKVIDLPKPEAPVFFPEPPTAVAMPSTFVMDWKMSPGYLDARVEAMPWNLLVFSQVAYPGWQVTVDDVPQRLEKYKDTFLAVTVPEGLHHVVFQFKSRSFAMGRVVSIAGLLMLVVYAIIAP